MLKPWHAHAFFRVYKKVKAVAPRAPKPSIVYGGR